MVANVRNLGLWSRFMPSETPTQRLATVLLDTPVSPWVRRRRRQGMSWRAIAIELRDATNGQVDVSPQALINWVGTQADSAGRAS